jgi:nicotinamidase-related amidase
MPLDLSPYLAPAQTAIAVFECQENVIGKGSRLPTLVAAVERAGMLPRLANLLVHARSKGVFVVFCNADLRADGLGRAITPLTERQARAPQPSGNVADTSVVSALGQQPGDVVIGRQHGMSGFHGTSLDPFLRSRGVRTLLVAGVSLNIGVVGTALEAVNHGYRVIIPSDCVAGDPPEYGEQVLRYTLKNLCWVASSDAVIAAWNH